LEKIPNIEAVLISKKNQITKEIDKAIENNSYIKQIYLAKEILQNHDAETIIAALLELKYENELCKTKYTEISEIRDRVAGYRSDNSYDK